jgi:hypothetical protein
LIYLFIDLLLQSTFRSLPFDVFKEAPGIIHPFQSIIDHESYLGSREFGLTGRQLFQAPGLTPAAIHYAIVRGENFLREDKEAEEELNKYLNNLNPPR